MGWSTILLSNESGEQDSGASGGEHNSNYARFDPLDNAREPTVKMYDQELLWFDFMNFGYNQAEQEHDRANQKEPTQHMVAGLLIGYRKESG